MEVTVERTDAGEARESYTMLVESEAIERSHRKLRREVCVSRVVVSVLLITCIAFCVILYGQQLHDSKNKENRNKEMAKDPPTGSQTGFKEDKKVAVPTPLLASLSIDSVPASERANLTWKPYHNLLNNFNFNLTDSLVIPLEGKYRLHLQLTCAEMGSNVQPTSQVTLTHRIVWYPKPGERTTILYVYDTVSSNTTWFKSMSSEVIYVFNKGDVIMVESDNANLIYTNGDWWAKNLLTIQLVSAIEDQ